MPRPSGAPRFPSAPLHKTEEGITQAVFHAHGHDDSCTMIITPGEAASNDKDLEITEGSFTLDETVQMDAFHPGTCYLQGISRLAVTIQAKTG